MPCFLLSLPLSLLWSAQPRPSKTHLWEEEMGTLLMAQDLEGVIRQRGLEETVPLLWGDFNPERRVMSSTVA